MEEKDVRQSVSSNNSDKLYNSCMQNQNQQDFNNCPTSGERGADEDGATMEPDSSTDGQEHSR